MSKVTARIFGLFNEVTLVQNQKMKNENAAAEVHCEVVIFLAVLALATDEPPLSVASAKTAAKACLQKITADESN